MYEIGRICVKIAGRDSNKKCVIIDVVDDKTVLIAGQTRKRKCNLKHLEPTSTVVKIKKNATASELVKVFKELGIDLKETKPKKTTARPKKQKKHKTKSGDAVQKPVSQAAPKTEPKVSSKVEASTTLAKSKIAKSKTAKPKTA